MNPHENGNNDMVAPIADLVDAEKGGVGERESAELIVYLRVVWVAMAGVLFSGRSVLLLIGRRVALKRTRDF